MRSGGLPGFSREISGSRKKEIKPAASAPPRGERNGCMKNLPGGVKWLILLLALALMAWLGVLVNDRASRVEMPPPDNLFGLYQSAAGEE